MIDDRTVESGGRRFAFREAGESTAPAVLLLHAMGPDATDWDIVAEALSDNHHVIALHQRGFGLRHAPEEYIALVRDFLAG